MAVRFGSARHDENGHLVGGKAGDQTGSEVAMQNYYMHKKGWYCFRIKDVECAYKLKDAMITACDNDNIGYNQNKHSQVVKVDTKKKMDTDCSGLVRACIIEATGVDVGNFHTATEPAILKASGLFEEKFKVKSKSELRIGDVLCSCEKGHTVIVVEAPDREVKKPADPKPVTTYYPKYTGNTVSIVTALLKVGEKDTSFTHRSKIAKKNNITAYVGTAKQNGKLLDLLKKGVLIKA